MAFLILQQKVHLELSVSTCTISNRSLFELIKGIASQAVSDRLFQSKRIAFRFILNIHFLHLGIHHCSKTLCFASCKRDHPLCGEGRAPNGRHLSKDELKDLFSRLDALGFVRRNDARR